MGRPDSVFRFRVADLVHGSSRFRVQASLRFRVQTSSRFRVQPVELLHKKKKVSARTR